MNQPAPVSPRVAEAIERDNFDQLTKAFADEFEARSKSDADAQAAAEARDLRTRRVAGMTEDLLLKRAAKDHVRKTYGKPPSPKRTWKRHGADFVTAVVRRDDKYLAEQYGCKRHQWPDGEAVSAKAAMAESSGTAGGYAVPTPMVRTVLAPFLQRSVFRSNGALQLATRNRSIFVPTPDVTTAQAGGLPPWAAGLNFVWTSEAKTRAETEPKFKQVELAKGELSGSIVLSRPLFDDGSSVALQDVLANLIGQAVLWLEDYAFFQGSGAGQPQGVFASPATIQVSRQTGGTVTYLDAATMLSKLPLGSLGSAVWAFNPTTLPKLLQLTDGGNRAVFFSTGNSPQGQRPQWSLAGLPAVATDTLPPLGTKGDLTLIDPRYYAVHDHGDAPGGSVEIIASRHVNFLTNQVTLRVVRRTEGQPLIEKPITLGDGATQVSPFIVLN